MQSPALIYWYFPDKEALFREVLGAKLPVLRAVRDPAGLRDRPPEEVLPMIGRRYLATFDNPVAQRMARLMVGEAIRRPELAEIFGNTVIKRLLGFLKDYMARQVELGRLRPHDVRSSARAFVGMDVARKYLQMGWTRARRYAKYEGGKKSKPRDREDPEKSRAAEIFYKKWREAAEDEEYLRLKEEHRRRNR